MSDKKETRVPSSLITHHSSTYHLLRVLSLKIFLVRALGPAPEAPVPDCLVALFPEVLVQVDGVLTPLVHDERYLVFVVCRGRAPFNFGGEIFGCDFGLSHGHVPHLRPGEIYGVAYGIHSLRAEQAHRVVNADVTLLVRQARRGERARPLERR